MHEREIRLTSVVAAALWMVGLGLIGVGIATHDAWADLGLYVTGGGAVLSIRRVVQSVVHARQDVFDMGRAYERGLRQDGRQVTPIR